MLGSVVENNSGEQSPEKTFALDDKGQFLERTVPTILSSFNHEPGVSFDIFALIIKPEDILSVCKTLKEDTQTAFDYLVCISVVDYLEYIQVVYHLMSTTKKHKIVIKVNLDSSKPSIPSLTSIWLGADWFEREGHDLFGVVFEGHPNLTPLLLYEGFEGHPGLKSYPLPEYKEW
jgi:NADH-quinone oxidoreductase subunit C